jgi:hypothetical protein
VRYQLWLSEAMLSGHSGVLSSITHPIYDDPTGKVGIASYDLDVYVSTTPLGTADLTIDGDSNHGPDKTLVFSGTVAYTDVTAIKITVDPMFSYGGSGNLLIDYVFSGFTNVGTYDGPLMQAVDANFDFWRVTSHTKEGDGVLEWGAIRTILEFQDAVVPEPCTLLVWTGLGAAGSVMVWRRKRQQR